MGARMNLELLTGSNWRGTLAVLAFSIAGTGIGAAHLARGSETLTTAMVFSVALATFVTLILNRAISDSRQRIRSLRTALRAIARGDMSHRIDTTRMGDLHSEATALNHLADAVEGSLASPAGCSACRRRSRKR